MKWKKEFRQAPKSQRDGWLKMQGHSQDDIDKLTFSEAKRLAVAGFCERYKRQFEALHGFTLDSTLDDKLFKKNWKKYRRRAKRHAFFLKLKRLFRKG